ncbi:MAG: DHA2 family efflux MFS transporter permease subunit [Methanoregulaceae archaeon]
MESCGPRTGRDQKLVLVILALSSFMASLDATIVNISLPSIAESFMVPMNSVSWVAMSYLLILSGFLLVMGKLGDMKGFRRVFIAGFAVFTLGSLLCGLAQSIESLIGFRLIQGIGAAALEAIGPAMIALYLPKEIRGRALGILATIVSLGIAAGPILGGVLTEFLSWHWIFFINVPVGIIAVAASFRYLPADQEMAKTAGRFDGIGAVLFFCALVTFLWPVNEGLTLGWTSHVITGSFVLSFILWVLFILRELRCGDPLCDFAMFRNRSFLAATLAAAIMMFAFSGTEYLLPFFFEGVLNYHADFAGLLLAIPAVALMFCGPVAGAISDKIGSRIPATISALFAAGTFLLISTFSPATSLLFIVLALLCAGIAVGFFFPPNMNQILGESKEGEEGAGSAIMMTMKNVGSTIGIAIMGTIAVYTIVVRMSFNPKTPVADILPEAMTEGFAVAVAAAAFFVIAAVILSAIAKDKPSENHSK